MKIHANSHDNDALHHLYEIFDVERDNVFKSEEIETEHIKAFRDKYGHNPHGNV